MKYPAQQFEHLVNALKELSNYFDLNSIHPCSLHFLVYQQGSERQEHNWLMIDSQTQNIQKNFLVKHKGLTTYKKLITVPNTFELYPNNTNDNQIQTAIKKALTTINNI